MEKITQLSWSHRARIAWTFVIVAVLTIPTGLNSAPAAALGNTPGPIPSVSFLGRGPGSVTVGWSAPWSDGGSAITDFRIDVREPGGRWTTSSDGVSTERTGTVNGLLAGRSYEIRVAAINANGDGPATVLGALTNMKAQFSNLCGEISPQQWQCFAGQNRLKTFPYSVYPDNQHFELASDLVNFDGQCAISARVGVICSTMSNNRYGELGQGLVGGPAGTFIVPGLPSDMMAVRSTNQRVCALESTGELWCWGQLSGSYPYDTVLFPTIMKRNVAQFEGNCARLRDNTVECLNADGQWTSIPMMPLITKLGTSADGTNACGITEARTVLCFNTVTKSMLERPGWNDVVDIIDSTSLCVLSASGTVKCYGNNSFGELGNGSMAAGYSTVRLPEPAIALVGLQPWGSTNYHYNCATGVSGAVYCWGDFISRFSTGLTTSTVPLAVSAPTVTTVQPMPAPGAVTGLVTAGRSTHYVSARWASSANSGDIPVEGYRVRWSVDFGASWTTTTTSATSWTGPFLPSNSVVQVTVAAYNASGIGAESSIVVSTTSPPARPTTLRQISRTGTSAVVGWTRSSDEDEPVTGYRVQWTSDSTTWHDALVAATESSATIQGLPVASASEIRVRAENAAGVSSWTPPLVVATSGMNAQSVVVTDSYGSPVIGGRVTWVTPNGAFQSAVDYGLTSNGSVTFPIAPAGQVNLTLNAVLLPGGATANYATTALFGAGRTPTVRFPAEPSRSQHVVRVTLPNGMPVMGATVTSTQLDQSATVDGVTFTTPTVVASGITNEFGEVHLVGYSNNSTTVSIEYNDGVLIQRLTGPLGRADADFQFEEMPWIDSTVDTTTASVGQLVSIPVTAETSAATVRVVAPASAAQTCRGRVLSAQLNAEGRATLKVCASASGKYALAGTGAVSTGAVQLNVVGTPSLGVRDVKAESRAHTTATVTWSAPEFTGGKPITGYTVKIVSPTGATTSKLVTGATATFTGLRGATTYTVSVTPITRLGNGVTLTRTVPVS